MTDRPRAAELAGVIAEPITGTGWAGSDCWARRCSYSWPPSHGID
ncbi:hypothetical protein [Gordonia jinghuaiqii]|nr:hypothetical protein [Gordonia jinghuaiqii]